MSSAQCAQWARRALWMRKNLLERMDVIGQPRQRLRAPDHDIRDPWRNGVLELDLERFLPRNHLAALDPAARKDGFVAANGPVTRRISDEARPIASRIDGGVSTLKFPRFGGRVELERGYAAACCRS